MSSYSVVVTGADMIRLQEEVNDVVKRLEERLEALELLVIDDNVAEDAAPNAEPEPEPAKKTTKKTTAKKSK